MKKLLLLIIPFLLTGCTVQYELQINPDLTVTENFEILNDTSYYDMLGNIETAYKYVVDIGMNEDGYTNYEYLKRNDLYGGKASKNYESLEDYHAKAKSYKKLFKDIQIERLGDIITLSTIGDMYIEKIVAIPIEETMDGSIAKDTYFSIRLPFKVIEHNADRANTDYNIYYWDINSTTSKEKSMMLSFDITKKHTSIKTVLESLDYTIVLIIGIIIIIVCFFDHVMKKRNENNRI